MFRQLESLTTESVNGSRFVESTRRYRSAIARRPPTQTTRQVLALLLAAVGVGVQRAPAYVLGPPLPGEPIVVSAAPGDQLYAKVSGDRVVYTSVHEGTSEVRYYDLVTGRDEAIPSLGGQDFLSAVDGTSVVYSHLTAAGFAIFSFDFATGDLPVELDPQPSPQRGVPAIGGDTVAWADYGPRAVYPEIAVYDRTSAVATLLTNDLYNADPRLSPDGHTVVWERCETYKTNCDVWQATLVDGAWWASPLAADPTVDESSPDTNGETVVYVRGVDFGDIAWRSAGGGAERVMGLPGVAGSPSISGAIIAFHYLPPAGDHWGIWVYDLRHDTLRQATFESGDAILPDVFVSAAGAARLAWTAANESSEYDVHALAFEVPSATPADEIEGLRSLVVAFGLPHGLETSLTAKLRAALAALEAGDLETVCTKLADFLAQVDAQSGKALTWDQADALRTAAEEIGLLLGC